jgi:sugar/nucleoside kinase (ribokinase family)
MSNRYLVIGPLSVDYLLTADGILHEKRLGGGAGYSAAGCRIWADEVGILSEVGSGFPEHLLDELAHHGIVIDNIRRKLSGQARSHFLSYDEVSHREEAKTTSKYAEMGRPIPKALLAADPPLAAEDDMWQLHQAAKPLPPVVASSRAVHFADVGDETTQRFGYHIRQLREPTISFDPPTPVMKRDAVEQLKLALHDVHIFMPSESQCREFFRPQLPSLWEMAERFAAMGPEVVVIKRGERGQAVYDARSSSRWHVPAYPVKPVDITGAGHVYCGAFIAGWGESQGEAVYAAACGSAAASMAIEGTGVGFCLEAMPGLAQARRDRVLESAHQA